MLVSRRAFSLLVGSGSAGLLFSMPAGATTLRALSLKELVAQTDRVALGTAVHHSSDFAYVGGSRRIVTWTRVLQEDDLLADETSSDELLVMTLGGKVGNLRQKVPGEAALTLGEKALLFTSPADQDGTRRIVGMAQGKFSLERSERGDIVRPILELPHLVRARPKPGATPIPPAVEVLPGKNLDEVRSLVRGAR